MKNLPLKLSLLIIGIGFLSLIGWYFTIPFLTQISSNYIPIAVLTSVLLMLSGTYYSIYFSTKKSKFLNTVANSLAGLSFVIALLNGIDFLWIPHWSFENSFFNWINSLKNVQNNILISPIATILFLLSSASFLIYQIKPIKKYQLFFIKGFFYIQFTISSAFLLVYIENISSLYLNEIYSLAFPTAIALFVISLLQLYMLKLQIWPFNHIENNSIQSKLVRSFLPMILFFVIVGNAIESHLVPDHNENFTNSILLFLLIILIIISYHIISKNVEKELNDAKSLYISLFENSTVGLYQTTPQGKIISANPALIKMLEYDSLEDLMQRDISKYGYVDPKKREEFKALIEAQGEITNFEAQWFTKNGNILTVEEGAKAIKNSEGAIIRYDGVVENISEFKVALNNLKTSEERLNTVLNINEIGIWTYNFEDQTSFRNLIHDKLFGYTALVSDWTYETYMSHVHTDDVAYVQECYTNAFEHGAPFIFDCRIVRTDGVTRWVKISGNHVYNKQDKPVGLSGMVQDITESKLRELEITEAKNELEDIFKNDISANFTTSVKGEILNCNRTFLKLFGFTSIKELQNKPITDLYFEPKKRMALVRSILLNKKVLNEEVDFINNKGEKINCLVNLVGVFSPNNKLLKTRGYLVNITKLKNAELDLKQSEERFRVAAKATNEVIWEHDLIKKTFWRSETFTTFFGWNHDDFGYSREDVQKRVHPEDFERVNTKIFHFFESDEEFWEDSYRLLTKDNGYAYVHDRAFKLKNKNGQLTKVIGSMANKTAEVLHQQQLRESEENYKNILENALIGVYQTDLNGHILFTNQYIKDQSGYILDGEMETINILDLYVHPEKRTEMLTSLQKNGVVTNFEVAFYTKTKQIKHCLMNAKLFENKIVGMLLDITQIKNNELELSKLSKAIYQSPVSVVITNLKGEIEYANPKTSETTGYSFNELFGKKTSIFKSGEKSPEEYNELWNTLLSGKEWFGEFHNKKKNGELFWEKASISPVLDAHNKITHFIAVKEDITQQKEILSELTIAKEKAEESDRLKSAFLANMSHEIRTPMNGILGFSELLKTPNLSIEKQKKYIEVIEKSGSRMLTTINDIIDISKIESKLVTIYSKEVNITKQVNEIYSFFAPEAAKKGLELFKTHDTKSNDLIITSDPDKIYAIIQNLVKNAIKFTVSGSIDMGYFVDKNILHIYVTDTGIGIPLNRQPYVFDRFVQADIEDKEVYEGSGLGLTISKSYAEMLGGTIHLKSILAQGSTFTFSLPYTNTLENSMDITEESKTSDTIATSHTTPLNILIVDDESLVQIYLQEILFKKADQLFVAENGLEALEVFKANPAINLILLDIQMPVMNGYEVARQIREFNKDVIIIAQTAFVQTGDREKALTAGCNNYISKPIDKFELFEKIDHFFSKSN
ncbi:PAS domain S-box protein [Lutibacter sp.]|uniref:PAS domain S-box protein n=1 Tax=Lutibacter sp. TaxID=1925666 RepID=UPI001A198E33|nr:PAS domain S-box protein [Lutibacter sp.]MBI9041915.1 PAS domain S-box protein [Lutibacter sp.]